MITSHNYKGLFPTARGAVVTPGIFSGQGDSPLALLNTISANISSDFTHVVLQKKTYRIPASRMKRLLKKITVGLFLRENDYNLYHLFL